MVNLRPKPLDTGDLRPRYVVGPPLPGLPQHPGGASATLCAYQSIVASVYNHDQNNSADLFL